MLSASELTPEERQFALERMREYRTAAHSMHLSAQAALGHVEMNRRPKEEREQLLREVRANLSSGMALREAVIATVRKLRSAGLIP